MKVIKYIFLYLVPVPVTLVKKFHNAGNSMGFPWVRIHYCLFDGSGSGCRSFIVQAKHDFYAVLRNLGYLYIFTDVNGPTANTNKPKNVFLT
jgi:hypothetical protein